MRRPLVLPKGLGALAVADPVDLHVRHQVARPGRVEDLRDVGVGAAGVAVFAVGAGAGVGPEAVDGPGAGGAGDRVGVPELDLLDQALGFEAARVAGGGGGAGELRVGAGFGLVGGGGGCGKDDWGGGEEEEAAGEAHGGRGGCGTGIGLVSGEDVQGSWRDCVRNQRQTLQLIALLPCAV